MKIHPAAAIFPEMGPEELEGLTEDIQKHGLLEAIETLEDKILDGRNRLKVCESLGIKPRFAAAKLNGIGPYEYVLSKNLHRRHLTQSQVAGILARMRDPIEKENQKRKAQAGWKVKKGEVERVDPAARERRRTSSVLADKTGGFVGKDTIGRAIRIDKKRPDLLDKVISGDLKVDAADAIVNGRSKLDKRTGKVTRVPSPVATPKRGMVLDLREGGFLDAVQQTEDLMRTVILLSKKRINAATKKEAVETLEWVAEEAAGVADNLKERK